MGLSPGVTTAMILWAIAIVQFSLICRKLHTLNDSNETETK